MCGILGTIPALDAVPMQAALDRLGHRGPDGSGLWHDGTEMSLGHRRLAIIDLTPDADQPMISGCGRYVLVYNGEIYNFVEIRQQLEDCGIRFRTKSDSEVLLAAYAHWGARCLERFNGMWALAIWDRRRRSLFLSRDRFGKKPLFYALLNHRFVFASEMKAIYPFLPRITASPHFRWMARHLLRYESTDRCLVDGIRRFPAGHWGLYRSGRLSLHRYWHTLDHLHDVPATYAEQVTHFQELFLDACRLRMRSDVPIGTALSGGLDSSATIGAMAAIDRQRPGQRVSPDWRHAFVATFNNTPLDERPYARAMVDHIGIEATYLNIDPTLHLDRLLDDLYGFEELYLTPPIPMVALYGTIKTHGVSVTLDGHGADELMAGYGHSLLHTLFDTACNPADLKNIISAYLGQRPAHEVQFRGHWTNLMDAAAFLAAAAVRKLSIGPPVSRDEGHPNFSRMDHFTRHLYVLTHETILPTLLRNYDRYAMGNGVEIRMPFMDHRIVTYMMSLPWTSKIRNGFTKSILRDAMKPFLPAVVTRRREKIGFNSPIVDWMKGPLSAYFLDMIHSRSFQTCDLIDPERTRAAVQRVVNEKTVRFADGVKAWEMLLPYLWEQSLMTSGDRPQCHKRRLLLHTP